MAFDLSASRRDRVSAQAAFNLEIGVASRANAGDFTFRPAVRELSRIDQTMRVTAGDGSWRPDQVLSLHEMIALL